MSNGNLGQSVVEDKPLIGCQALRLFARVARARVGAKQECHVCIERGTLRQAPVEVAPSRNGVSSRSTDSDAHGCFKQPPCASSCSSSARSKFEAESGGYLGLASEHCLRSAFRAVASAYMHRCMASCWATSSTRWARGLSVREAPKRREHRKTTSVLPCPSTGTHLGFECFSKVAGEIEDDLGARC